MGDTPLELHSHTTIGLSPLSYLTAAEHGVSALQTGCGPLAGGTSLPDAQRLVANLRELGHTVDVDDRLLGLVAAYFRKMARAEGLPTGGPSDFDAAFLRHQMAGGTMTTMRRQLAELGLAHRFDEMIDEVSAGPRRPRDADHGDAVPADRDLAGAGQPGRGSSATTRYPTR